MTQKFVQLTFVLATAVLTTAGCAASTGDDTIATSAATRSAALPPSAAAGIALQCRDSYEGSPLLTVYRNESGVMYLRPEASSRALGSFDDVRSVQPGPSAPSFVDTAYEATSGGRHLTIELYHSVDSPETSDGTVVVTDGSRTTYSSWLYCADHELKETGLCYSARVRATFRDGTAIRNLSTKLRHAVDEFTEQRRRARPPARAC